jgi:hypothetical protein
MTTPTVAVVALLSLFALSKPAFGQTAAADTSLSAALTHARELYLRSFTGLPQLINGPEYVDYAKPYHARIDHQFFPSPEKQPGSVYYNDHHFTGLLLAYDVVLDKVLISPPNSPLTLRLVDEKVRYFYLKENHFVRLVADEAKGEGIRTGFYELLVDSTVQVVAKRAKRLKEHIIQKDIDVEFIKADKLFLKKDNKYYPITKKASIIRLFSDRDKEIQAYLREQKLSFKKAQFESAVVRLAKYYCSLPPR